MSPFPRDKDRYVDQRRHRRWAGHIVTIVKLIITVAFFAAGLFLLLSGAFAADTASVNFAFALLFIGTGNGLILWGRGNTGRIMRNVGILLLILPVIASFAPTLYGQLRPDVLVPTIGDTIGPPINRNVIHPTAEAYELTRARFSCTFQLIGTSASFEYERNLQQCIQNATQQEDEGPPSQAVTNPIEVRIADTGYAALSDSLRTESTLHYRPVFDINGRMIDIPFENVVYGIVFTRQQKIDAARIYVPSSFSEGDKKMAIARAGEKIYDTLLEQHEKTLEEAVREDARLDVSFRPGRDLSFQTTFAYEEGDPKDHNGIEGSLDRITSGTSGYTVKEFVIYTFDAEAAFTRTSRWREGDFTIQVWDDAAWDRLSFDEKEQWENEHCATIPGVGGSGLSVQRTAALTTPVQPVMWTRCGNLLVEEVAETGNVGVSITAYRDIGRSDVYRFEILDAASEDCFPQNQEEFQSAMDRLTGTFYIDDPNVPGFVANETVEVPRPVAVSGERTTITCSLSMQIRAAVEHFGSASTELRK